MLDHGRVLAAVTYSLALVTSVSLVNGVVLRIKTTDKTIQVPGAAKRRVKSDRIFWHGQLAVQSTTLEGGYLELAASLERLADALERHGIPRNDIEPGAVRTSEQYARDKEGRYMDKVLRYELVQPIEVTSTRLAPVARASQKTAELVSMAGLGTESVRFNASAPSYRYTRLEELKQEVLAEATQNARQRAHEIARVSGSQLRTLLTANLGDIRVVSPGSRERYSDDTSSVEKDVISDVTLTFRLE
jgi:hypothetical protein